MSAQIILLLVAICCCAAVTMPDIPDTNIETSSPQTTTTSDAIIADNLASITYNAQLQFGDLVLDEADDEAVRLVSAEQLDDDMDVAETHLFRPLFRYRAQVDERRRRRINDY